MLQWAWGIILLIGNKKVPTNSQGQDLANEKNWIEGMKRVNNYSACGLYTFVPSCTLHIPKPVCSLSKLGLRTARRSRREWEKKLPFADFRMPPLVLSQIYELLAVWCLRYRVHSLGHSLVTHREGMIKHYLKSLKNLKRWRSPQSSEKKNKHPNYPACSF